MELIAEPVETFPYDISLPDYILQRAEQFGQKPALIDDTSGRSYTYRQLVDNVTRCSNGLAELGLGSQDRLCLFVPNCIEFPVVLLATLRLSASCVPVNSMCTKYELYDLISDCEPRMIVTSVDRLDRVNYAIKQLPAADNIKVITITEHPGYTCVESLFKSAGGKCEKRSAAARPFDSRANVATICYSSGTTGRPKGCMQRHYSYIANARSYMRKSYPSNNDDVSRACDDVTIASLPMFHAWGTLAFIAYSLSVGQQVVVMSKFDASSYLQLVHKYQATLLYVVPPLLVSLLRNADTDRLRQLMSSVRRIVSSAVALNDSIAQKFQTILPRVDLCQAYGLTETALVTSMSPGGWKYGSSGKLFDIFSAKIVDAETGKTLGVNENGELLVKSPSVFIGYWKSPQITSCSFDADGWFRTGDFAHFDADGELFVVDRVKDLIKYKGYQVAPIELESVLLMVPDVIDAAVVGIKDDNVGEIPCAFVVLRNVNVKVDDILAFVDERVSPYKRLRGGVRVIDEIPRTASGKIIRRQLIANYNKPVQRDATQAKL
jgi:acyl-CoA synthetase (AMP-forming)/AMP-acid ligase II